MLALRSATVSVNTNDSRFFPRFVKVFLRVVYIYTYIYFSCHCIYMYMPLMPIKRLNLIGRIDKFIWLPSHSKMINSMKSWGVRTSTDEISKDDLYTAIMANNRMARYGGYLICIYYVILLSGKTFFICSYTVSIYHIKKETIGFFNN